MAHSRYIEFSLCVVAFSLVMTSQPFTQSQATSRRPDFVWSSKMVGGERVAVVSVRLDDDERGRRSLPLTGDEDPFRKTITRRDSEGGGEGATESHHHHHHHTHRHHHGERGREESHAERISLNDVQPLEDRIRSPTTPLKEVLAATGLDINSSIFANLTTTSVPARRGRRGRRRQRSGRKGNKVKRDKKRKSRGNRRRKEGKRRRRPKNTANSRRCRELKGRRKRRCREEAEASEEKDMFSFITNIHDRPFVVAVSGSEACQYHNLAQCARQVGLPSSDPETLILVVKCRFREEFLKCMEEQRKETCDPNFRTTGNMTALRNRIRDVIWTSNSCLISEVIEG